MTSDAAFVTHSLGQENFGATSKYRRADAVNFDASFEGHLATV